MLLVQTAAAFTAVAPYHHFCFWCSISHSLTPKSNPAGTSELKSPSRHLLGHDVSGSLSLQSPSVCSRVSRHFSRLMAVSPSLPFLIETSSLTTFYWMSVVSASCFVVVHMRKSRVRNRTSKLKCRCLLFLCFLSSFCVAFRPSVQLGMGPPLPALVLCRPLLFERQHLIPSGHWAPCDAAVFRGVP